MTLRWLKYVAWIALAWLGPAALADDDAWLPVTPQDLQVKTVPEASGASAIQLYYANFIYEHDRSEFFYHRIKVLNESGRKYADVEIPVYPDEKITDLQARCFRPDGSIVDQPVKPMEKMVLKGHGLKFRAQTLTFPEVAVGSILEYKYKVHTKRHPSMAWLLEHELFTVKERFLLKYDSKQKLIYDVSGSKAQPAQAGKDAFDLELSNMPAFHAEELMPPERDYKAVVRFHNSDSDAFVGMAWSFAAARIGSYYNHFIGQYKEVRELSQQATQGAAGEAETLRRLYDRAQQLRNLSYERERTNAETRQEELKENKSVLDVLKHGYGSRDDVTLFFVALARAAGFNANVVLNTDRSESLYLKDHQHPGHYDAMIASVRNNQGELFLDPGTKLCPFGMTRWFRTASPALKLGDFSGTFFDLPQARAEDAFMLRTARMSLDQEGRLKGDITVRYEAGEALEHRLLMLQSDEAGRKKGMEDELKQWLPEGAVVTMTDSAGWDQKDQPLVANFSVDIPAYASVAGKRLLTPTSLFLTKQKAAFQAADRKYPVYFPYPFTEFDTIVIELPQDMSVENFPADVESQAAFATYRNKSKVAENRIVTSRSLVLKQYYFQQEKYGDLKSFFSQVKVGDEAHAVLKQGAAEVKKGN